MAEIWTPEGAARRSQRRAESQIAHFIRTRPAALKRALLSGELRYDVETGTLQLVPAKSQADIERRQAIAAGHEGETALTPEEEQELQVLIRRLDEDYLMRLAQPQ